MTEAFMKANAVPLVALFEKKMRLEIPLFQRQYVWGLDQQWEPLWEDITRKFAEYLEGRTDAPVHFLGAIVLDQKQTPATHVERRMVIDGQQRLTTLQIFLTAFRDYCKGVGAEALAEECTNFTLNKGMMPDPDVDKFKVWPTQLDRQYFRDVVSAGSPAALEEMYPLVRRKYQRKPDPRPRMIECYLFFSNQLRDFFEGSKGEAPLCSDVAPADRLEQCFQALRNALLVVAIDLEQGDDPQVIFETLNARGEPLLPADLLRNYIFLRAAREGSSQEDLYKTYWEPFDEVFWREIVSQGRIYRPRSDLLIQHYLASQQAIDIPIKHLYVEYRHWIEKEKPFGNVEGELKQLSASRDLFRSLLQVPTAAAYSHLAKFLVAFDIGTAYPLMLLLAEKNVEYEIFEIIESYLVRRAVCGLTNKNYNRVFLTLTRLLRREGVNVETVRKYFNDLRGDTVYWPNDDEFRSSWAEKPAYYQLNNPRLVYLFTRINSSFLSSKTEDIEIKGPLSIEHIMPQEWVANWPLVNGEKGLTNDELWDADATEPKSVMSATRNQLIQTMGNLTLLTQSLNTVASNSNWETKRLEFQNSLLPINKDVLALAVWDEAAIRQRGQLLFERAKAIWPR